MGKRNARPKPPPNLTPQPPVIDPEKVVESYVRLMARTRSWRNAEAQVRDEAGTCIDPQRNRRLLDKADLLADFVAEMEKAISDFSKGLDVDACRKLYAAWCESGWPSEK